MVHATTIAAWLLLLSKLVASLMVFFIVMLGLSWAIRSRRQSKKRDAERG